MLKPKTGHVLVGLVVGNCAQWERENREEVSLMEYPILTDAST